MIVTSANLLAEAARVLRYPKLRLAFPDLDVIACLIREISITVEPRHPLPTLADDADNWVLEAAIEGHADVIVTGDRHLLDRGEAYDGVKLRRSRDFLVYLDA